MLSEYYTDKNSYSKVGNARKKNVLEIFTPLEAKTVLDVGCGQGVFGIDLKKVSGAVVHGVDISAPSIEEAKKCLDVAVVADIEAGDIPRTNGLLERYDVLLISEVLEHLFFPEKLLEGVKQFADKDTSIIVTVPNVLFWKNRLAIFFGKFEYVDLGLMDRGHIHFFTWKTFTETLHGAGLDIVEVNNNIPTRGTKLLGTIFPGLFAFQFIVRCRLREGENK